MPTIEYEKHTQPSYNNNDELVTHERNDEEFGHQSLAN